LAILPLPEFWETPAMEIGNAMPSPFCPANPVGLGYTNPETPGQPSKKLVDIVGVVGTICLNAVESIQALKEKCSNTNSEKK
jgi:hypothetical protein